MRKRIVEELILACFLTVMIVCNRNIHYDTETFKRTYNTDVPEEMVITVEHDTLESLQEEIRNEIAYGEIELLAQLVHAEAGNQDETGKRYVADVVLNRVDSNKFPDTIEKVIYQNNPVQFNCVNNGALTEAAWTVTEEDYQVALEEYSGERLNTEIHYFRTDRYGDGIPAFKHGDHYFSK